MKKIINIKIKCIAFRNIYIHIHLLFKLRGNAVTVTKSENLIANPFKI